MGVVHSPHPTQLQCNDIQWLVLCSQLPKYLLLPSDAFQQAVHYGPAEVEVETLWLCDFVELYDVLTVFSLCVYMRCLVLFSQPSFFT